MTMDQERDIRGVVAVVLHLLTAQREAIPGVPGAGPYPATVDEVADEIVRFVLELEASGIAHGLSGMVRARITDPAAFGIVREHLDADEIKRMEGAPEIVAREVDVFPGGTYCRACDLGRHVCPGCGADVSHGTIACGKCAPEIVAQRVEPRCGIAERFQW